MVYLTRNAHCQLKMLIFCYVADCDSGGAASKILGEGPESLSEPD